MIRIPKRCLEKNEKANEGGLQMKPQNFQAFLALTIVALALSACRPGDRNSKNELDKAYPIFAIG